MRTAIVIAGVIVLTALSYGAGRQAEILHMHRQAAAFNAESRP